MTPTTDPRRAGPHVRLVRAALVRARSAARGARGAGVSRRWGPPSPRRRAPRWAHGQTGPALVVDRRRGLGAGAGGPRRPGRGGLAHPPRAARLVELDADHRAGPRRASGRRRGRAPAAPISSARPSVPRVVTARGSPRADRGSAGRRAATRAGQGRRAVAGVDVRGGTGPDLRRRRHAGRNHRHDGCAHAARRRRAAGRAQPSRARPPPAGQRADAAPPPARGEAALPRRAPRRRRRGRRPAGRLAGRRGPRPLRHRRPQQPRRGLRRGGPRGRAAGAFSPALRDGVPVPTTFTFTTHFRLDTP